MSTSYYSKELPDQPIYINGKPYRFELLATDDPALSRHLDSAAAKHVGGIIKLSKAEFDAAQDLKKKQTSQPSFQKRLGREEVKQKIIPRNQRSRGAAHAVEEEGNPVELTPEQAAIKAQDREQFKPKTARGILA
jgi:hypothetical protein